VNVRVRVNVADHYHDLPQEVAVLCGGTGLLWSMLTENNLLHI